MSDYGDKCGELREKVARALMLHHDLDPDVFVHMHGGYSHWLDAADAAIAAIRADEREKIGGGND